MGAEAVEADLGWIDDSLPAVNDEAIDQLHVGRGHSFTIKRIVDFPIGHEAIEFRLHISVHARKILPIPSSCRRRR
jgi:hypothetical protein